MGTNKNKINNNIISNYSSLKPFPFLFQNVDCLVQNFNLLTLFLTFSLQVKGFAEKTLTNVVSRAIIEVPRTPSVI